MFLISALLISAIYIQVAFGGACPNACNGNGYCDQSHGTFTCFCFPGFHGPDCSVRLCPSGKAWVDHPQHDQTAHYDYTECSNMGICDRDTGKCICRAGYTGASCNQMVCPLASGSNGLDQLCAGHGRCMSLSNINSHPDYINYYGTDAYSADTHWDGDMIHGCVCDEGYTGVDCALRACTKGDDPLTTGQQDEIQYLDCTWTTAAGGVQLAFRGRKTRMLPYDARAPLIEAYLEELTPMVDDVTVTIMEGDTLCSAAGSVTRVTFHVPQGPQADSPLGIIVVNGLVGTTAVAHSGAASAVNGAYVSQTGTKEYATCSNHGLCDTDPTYNPVTYKTGAGICMCYDGFRSSDGKGAAGNRDDCGFNFLGAQVHNASITTICAISGKNGELCAGHGVCTDHTTGYCACLDGYSGVACDDLTCNSTNLWFGNVGANHTATAECGGAGWCDGDTGVCTDCGGSWGHYDGNACEALSCYKGDDGATPCSGNGACLTLSEMAAVSYNPRKMLAGVVYTDPWDANLVRGCSCERAVSHDNVFYKDYDPLRTNENPTTDVVYYYELVGQADGTTEEVREKFHRGPFAWAATDFTGYTCQQKRCPTGDNPRTRGLNEIQRITCTATAGNFTLLFRENSTMSMAWDVTKEGLAHRLKQLYTVRNVEVTYSSGTALCTSGGTNTADIEFLSEYGDVPMIQLGTAENFEPVGYTFVIQQITRGTKEDAECSQVGICDESTGRCTCMNGYVSSADSVAGGKVTSGGGNRGDCGYETKFQEVIINV